MADAHRNGSPSAGRRHFVAKVLTWLGPSRGTERDLGALNLLLVVLGATGCLAGFLLYLTWKSFTVAAPSVLFTRSSASRDYKYAKGYEPNRPQPVVNQTAEMPFEVLSTVEQGQWLYRKNGCALCHGREGQGGVTNPNYIKGTFPRLDDMGSKLSLEFPEDAEVVVKLLREGISLKDLSKPDLIVYPPELDIPDAAKVSAKYGAIAKIFFEGTQAGKKDESGPEPIVMPAFRGVLSESQMNQIIASFLILYPVREEEWQEEAEQQ